MSSGGATSVGNDLGEPPVIISYQSGIAWLAPGIFALMAVMGVLWFVAGLVQGGFPVWFGVLWFAGLGWIAFNMIWRQARSVVVVNGTLYWTTWFKQEQIALKDIVRLSLASRGSIQVIECRDGRKLRVAVAQGYRPFIERLARTYPDLDIELGAYSRFVDKVRLFKAPRNDEPTGAEPPGDIRER
jgi:hypothetical protein